MVRLQHVLPLSVLMLTAITYPTSHAFQSAVFRVSKKMAPLSMIRKSKKVGSTKTTSSGGFGAGSSSSSSSSTNGNGNMVAKKLPPWAARFPFAGTVRPGARAERRSIDVNDDKGIMVIPDYAQDGRPKNTRPMLPWIIEVKTQNEIDKMRESGKLARTILDMAGRAVKPGITTEEIDDLVHRATVEVS